MKKDVFGNLAEWGPAIETLGTLRAQHTLDRHQDGLVQILRYRDNWRLREAALQCVREVCRPSDELLQCVLDILTDEDVYPDARILAAAALASVALPREGEKGKGRPGPVVTADLVTRKMDELLKSPNPPSFRRAIGEFRNALGKTALPKRRRPHSSIRRTR